MTSPLSRRSLLRGGLAAAGGVAVAPALLGTTAASAAGDRRAPDRSSPADPAAPAYLGYRRADYAKPYARYFTERTGTIQSQVRAALTAPPVAATDVPTLSELRTELSADTGYSKVENGYTVLPDGTQWAAALTRMPGVRPEMWDWWFGWHSSESARYKLWHPEAHIHAALATDLADEPGLSDRQRYVGNTSYVDEYLPDYRGGVDYVGGDKAGGVSIQPGISFMDPDAEGFDLSAFDGTIIVGRGGPQGVADTSGLFCHQVRATADGSEMRSRFYQFGDLRSGTRTADPAVAAAAIKRGPMPAPAAPKGGWGLMLHCGQEMNHLASFLPALYREFRRR